MLHLFRRATPESKERARLAALDSNSRSIEGTLTDETEGVLYFTYEVRGVTYHAAQDVKLIGGAADGPQDYCLGPITVRYSTTNPANSMVLSQQWSGLRNEKRKGMKVHAEPHA